MSTALIADPKSPTALPKNALRRSSFITVTPIRAAQRSDLERTPLIRQSLTSRPVAGLRVEVLQRSDHGTHGARRRTTLERYPRRRIQLPHLRCSPAGLARASTANRALTVRQSTSTRVALTAPTRSPRLLVGFSRGPIACPSSDCRAFRSV